MKGKEECSIGLLILVKFKEFVLTLCLEGNQCPLHFQTPCLHFVYEEESLNIFLYILQI